MRLLAFDTALNACSAALSVDGRVVARRHAMLRQGHAERLVPMLEELRQEAGTGYRELDLLAVTVGPGTFTGVRVGLAAARGLALPFALPVLGVTTLQTLAWAVPAGGPVLAAVDARRGEVYVQAFSPALQPLDAPAVLTPVDAAQRLPAARWRIVGSGGAAMLEQLDGAELLDGAAEPDAADIARHAAALRQDAIPGTPPAPLYLRQPDARLPAGAAAS